ncbi:hypothetical protein [Clostridium saccharoperbutylacetonicum]
MLNKKLKRVISCATLIFCMMSTTAFAGTWSQEIPGDPGYWMYIKDDGSHASDEWIYDNGSWYYINHGGNMLRGIRNAGSSGLYCFESSGKLVTGGFVDEYDYFGIRKTGNMYFADKDGHPVDGLFMVDGVLYKASNHFIDSNYVVDSKLYICNESYNKYGFIGGQTESEEEKYVVKCKFVNGKVLDADGKPFAANSKIYTQIKYLPQYDSKGNLIGAIQNPNGYRIF